MKIRATSSNSMRNQLANGKASKAICNKSASFGHLFTRKANGFHQSQGSLDWSCGPQCNFDDVNHVHGVSEHCFPKGVGRCSISWEKYMIYAMTT